MSERLLVGTRKGLFRMRRGAGGAWTMDRTWFLGDPVSMVLAAPGGRLYACLDLGHFGAKTWRLEDDGDSWSEVPAPAYPPKPDHVDDRDPMRDIEVPWTTRLVWCLEAGRDDELWCGTLPGGLFHSTDGGYNWALVRALWDDPRRRQWMGGGYDFAGIHSVMVDPRDNRHVTVAVSVGGVWTTRDGGATWELIGHGLRNAYMPPDQADDPLPQDPHRVVHCPAAPDRLWMQHHNGIFVSDDGGVQWRELHDVPVSSFGFAVAVHPTDPDTAWFVPADKDERRYPVDGCMAVTRTRDGGRSFDVLRTGLPQGHAYDLVYRHALDVGAAGNTLAFGSTTGSLWISEDQGDTWQAVSHHLPPVACVRFEPG